jgi:pantothenate kinase
MSCCNKKKEEIKEENVITAIPLYERPKISEKNKIHNPMEELMNKDFQEKKHLFASFDKLLMQIKY